RRHTRLVSDWSSDVCSSDLSMSVDMTAVQHRKRLMVEGLQELHLNQTTASGAQLFRGEARFADRHTLEIDLRDGGKKLVSGDRRSEERRVGKEGRGTGGRDK